ncbi:MAG TPA: hypothetical protein VK498_03590 [Ferruginibacter sp.]|nr:hypothetical protein [Ferruginibacter sp.]
MKSETMGFITPINKKDMKELMKETKETIATGMVSASTDKTFAEVDMWRIRKNLRTTRSMRRRIF